MIKAKGRRSGRGCRKEKRDLRIIQKLIEICFGFVYLAKTKLGKILKLIQEKVKRWPRRKNGQSLETSGKLKISK